MIYNSITETIGKTPVVRLNKLAPDHVDMFVKIEAFNPGGSVKDRLANALIDDAERKGLLKPGQTVIEATSGNTGIALAMVCAARGYPFVATMVETFSVERRQIMRALGAKVILTPGPEKASGMKRVAEELAEKYGWYLPRQFENEANPEIHRMTTGREILDDFRKRRLDYFVSGYGTGGTMTGVGQALKAGRPECQIVACEPEAAALMSGNEWAPHKIQGWTPNFIPDVMDTSLADEIVKVCDDMARDTAFALAQEEGLFVGLTSGAAVSAALKVAEKAEPGSTILVMLADTGERYLSSWMFEEIEKGCDGETMEAWAVPEKKARAAGGRFGFMSKKGREDVTA